MWCPSNSFYLSGQHECVAGFVRIGTRRGILPNALRVKSTTTRDTTRIRSFNASHVQGSSEPFFVPGELLRGLDSVNNYRAGIARGFVFSPRRTSCYPHLHQSRNLVPDVSPAGAKRRRLRIAPISCFSPHSLCLLFISQGQNHDTSNSPYVSA